MRTILTILGILFCCHNSAQAGNFVEGYRLFRAKTPSVDSIDAYLYKRFEKSDLGMSGFFLVTEGWAEGYAGPTYAPTDWAELNVALGGEQTPNGLGLRYGTGLWLGTGPWSALINLEANNDVFLGDYLGFWYDFTGTYAANNWLKLGIRDRRFVGAGPHISATIPSTPLSVWVTWTPIDPEGLAKTDLTRFLLGSQLTF